MLDACVLFNMPEDLKKRLNLAVGNAKIKDKLSFGPKEMAFFSPKNEDDLKQAIKQTLPFGIINSELIHKKDSMHFIKSGIDDSLAKEMAQKKIAIVFNLGLIISNSGIQRAQILRRMKENMKKAVKFDAPVLFASCAKDKYGLFNGQQIKEWANYLGIDNFKRAKESFEKIFY